MILEHQIARRVSARRPIQIYLMEAVVADHVTPHITALCHGVAGNVPVDRPDGALAGARPGQAVP